MSVGGIRMYVQITPEVAALDERRQRARHRRLDLASVLTQLRCDPRQSERPIHSLLRLAGEAHLVAKETVFAQLPILLLGATAQADVVILAAGEVEQCRAEALRRHRAHVDLQPVAQNTRRLRGTGGEQLP
jgi:hypothetical protein